MSSRDRLCVWAQISTQVRHLIGSLCIRAQAVLLSAGQLILLESEWDYYYLDDLDC